jgi:ribonucleoside-triphosphate reductase
MQRNRRIGASFNGAWQFVEQQGWPEIDRWMDTGFAEILRWDHLYSEWLCIRESIRHTTVKPDGTGSLQAGVTPGAHASPGWEYYLRAIRYGADSNLVPLHQEAGYTVEPAYGDEQNTVVIYYPIAGPTGVRGQDEASVYEKMHLAARMQRYWSDNSVSFTLTYDKATESKELGHVLRMFEGQVKSVSFLAMEQGTYPQMPYQKISREDYEQYVGNLRRINVDALYGVESEEAVMDRFCTNDVCEIPPQ